MPTKKANHVGILQWIVIVFVLILLASQFEPLFNRTSKMSRLSQDMSCQRAIIFGCLTYAADWNGEFPSPEHKEIRKNGSFTSVDAFNQLVPDYIDMEAIFWIETKNPAKMKPPIEDAELHPNECSYGYVTGQTAETASNSPLMMDGEMVAPGVYGKFHPWLKSRKAIVGFCGGHVREMRLTSGESGATVMSMDREMSDIFQQSPNGLLATEQKNILLPTCLDSNFKRSPLTK